jgi:uncharacterized protein DUF4124
MHPWRSWIVLASLAAFTGQASVIYKWTDSDGVVHYSDQSVPGAEKIYTNAASRPGSSESSPDSHPSGGPQKAGSGVGSYIQFSITSPTPDQTFFGDEPVSVHLAIDPALKAEQTLTWHLNGKELDDQGPATSFTLPHLDRGTYIIAATLTDTNTGESRTTESVSFFVRQPSALSPQHKNP